MNFSIIVIFSVLLVCAYSYPQNLPNLNFGNAFKPPQSPPVNTNIYVGHGKLGTDINAQVGARLWQSQNGRTDLNGQGSYSQHLGGPYGNSRPNFGGGLTLVHRF